MNRKILLFVALIVGISALVLAATLQQEDVVTSCSDTDNGLVYNVTGTISGLTLNMTNYSYTDYCFNSNVVVEFACDVRGNVTYGQAWSQTCLAFNKTCIAGRCQ